MSSACSLNLSHVVTARRKHHFYDLELNQGPPVCKVGCSTSELSRLDDIEALEIDLNAVHSIKLTMNMCEFIITVYLVNGGRNFDFINVISSR